MTQLFLRLFNISATAGWIVLAVVVVRLLFRKMPRWGCCLLWGIVGLRLLLPFTLESSLSLLPSPELIPQNITALENPAIYSGIPAVNQVINPIFVAEPVRQNISLEQLLDGLAWVWLVGLLLILIYGLVSYWMLCRQVRVSVVGKDNVYLCDHIQSPFLLGFFKPRIYVPSGVEEALLPHILAHEQAHIRRRDYLWKPLGFLLLAIYWFNPLLWVGYILLCRDIERACDEKVIADKDHLFRLTYMDALVSCSLHRRMILACPVAFGEVSVKTRLKGIARYKKPTVLVILASVLTCMLVSVCFLTTPKACAHEYTGETTQKPTCVEHGLQRNTCRLCDHTYMQTVDCTEHTYKPGQYTRKVTCIQTGYLDSVCAYCGQERRQELPMNPHIPSGARLEVAPNCSQTGGIMDICKSCGVQFVLEVWETNDVHVFRHKVIREATCQEDGVAADECTLCGYRKDFRSVEAGHSYRVVDSREATCLSPGLRTEECTRCGHREEYQTANTGHSYRDAGGWQATCQSAGLQKQECTRCGHLKETIIPKKSYCTDGINGKCTTCGRYMSPLYVYDMNSGQFVENRPQISSPSVSLPTTPAIRWDPYG